MKNHNKDAQLDPNRCMVCKKNIMRKSTYPNRYIKKPAHFQSGFIIPYKYIYFFWYMTSFTIFTVLSILGKAAATRFGA
jgi:hypothetical protein